MLLSALRRCSRDSAASACAVILSLMRSLWSSKSSSACFTYSAKKRSCSARDSASVAMRASTVTSCAAWAA